MAARLRLNAAEIDRVKRERLDGALDRDGVLDMEHADTTAVLSIVTEMRLAALDRAQGR